MSSGFSGWWFVLLKVVWGAAFPRSVINNRDGIIFAFLWRERGCVQVLRYLLGQVNSQKGGKGEAEHPNSHKAVGTKAWRIWRNCLKFFGPHGLENSGSWCREGLSPGSAPSILPGLSQKNSLIYFFVFSLCWSSLWNLLLVFSFQMVKMEPFSISDSQLSPFYITNTSLELLKLC